MGNCSNSWIICFFFLFRKKRVSKPVCCVVVLCNFSAHSLLLSDSVFDRGWNLGGNFPPPDWPPNLGGKKIWQIYDVFEWFRCLFLCLARRRRKKLPFYTLKTRFPFEIQQLLMILSNPPNLRDPSFFPPSSRSPEIWGEISPQIPPAGGIK